MILSKWNKARWKNEVFAVKDAKIGNDVYRSRVEQRFRGLSHKADAIEFFNPRTRLAGGFSYLKKLLLKGISME